MAEANPPMNQTNERHEVRRIISPFDLTAADNPEAVISKPLLRGRNYDEWACAFKMALCSRKKFGFLDGSIPKPLPDSPDYEDWDPINALLVSWIKMSIDLTLQANISHRKMQKICGITSRSVLLSQVDQRINKSRQNLRTASNMAFLLEEYFGRLTKIWDTVASL